MLPLDVIKKYYPAFVYTLCCGLMQYFYGNDWDKDIEDSDLKNEED